MLAEFGPFRKFSEDLIAASLAHRSRPRKLIMRTAQVSNEPTKAISLAEQEGYMSALDFAVVGFYSFVALTLLGLILLLAAHRH